MSWDLVPTLTTAIRSSALTDDSILGAHLLPWYHIVYEELSPSRDFFLCLFFNPSKPY